MIDLDLIRSLVAVVDESGFTPAAVYDAPIR